jgi:uncharacterized RDD family membrane protein YckC
MSSLLPEPAADLPDTNAWLAEGVGFWRRALARLIDAVFHLMVAFVASVAAGIAIAIAAALTHRPTDAAVAAVSALSATGVLAAYLGATATHVFAEGLHGSTLGKRICGIRVVAEDGRPATLVAALKREIAFFVDALFFGLVAVLAMSSSPRRQRTGDKWAHTMVVRLAAVPPAARLPAWRFVLAALAGVFTDGGVIFAELIWRAAVA